MNVVRDIRIIEAILFASGDPVSENDLKDKIVNKNKFDDYINEIQKFYEFRGINIIKTGLKWSFRTSSEIGKILAPAFCMSLTTVLSLSALALLTLFS